MGKKTSSTVATTTTTRTCEPVGVAELAVLSLPLLFFISPMLKGFNIAGLFGVDFKEVQERAAKQATEQVIRVFIAQDAGSKSQTALNQAEGGNVTDLPTA